MTGWLTKSTRQRQHIRDIINEEAGQPAKHNWD